MSLVLLKTQHPFALSVLLFWVLKQVSFCWILLALAKMQPVPSRVVHSGNFHSQFGLPWQTFYRIPFPRTFLGEKQAANLPLSNKSILIISSDLVLVLGISTICSPHSSNTVPIVGGFPFHKLGQACNPSPFLVLES